MGAADQNDQGVAETLKDAALRDLKRALMDDRLSGRVRVDIAKVGGAARKAT